MRTYLTVYMDQRGDVQQHTGGDPVAFARDVGDAEADVLYRAVIDGTVVEYDTNN